MLFWPSLPILMSATPEEPFTLRTEFHADAGVAQGIFERGAERIVANISEHADGVAEPGDADGLVRAFAAVKRAEILADDGFAGQGDVIGGGDEIEIDAADDHDWFAHVLEASRSRVCGKRDLCAVPSRARRLRLRERRGNGRFRRAPWLWQ